MNIHIHRPVEYEKIIANQHPRNIELTRHRMTIQQLLDSGESISTLESRLKTYIDSFDNVYASIDPTLKLQKQPNFHWVIDSENLQSSCWKFEAILPRIVLSNVIQQQAMECLQDEKYVDASKRLDNAIQQHTDVVKLLHTWTWKLASANHPVLQTKWNMATIHRLHSMKHLCMLCVGIRNETNVNALYTVAQRATAAAATSIAFWPDQTSTLKLCQSMQHLLSSHILWNREEYGGSIERLETWFGHDHVNTFGYTCLKEEIEKVPFLLHERIQINHGAYFEPIKAALPLPTALELIHMGPEDVPHPSSTRNTPMEPALDEVHAPEQELSSV